MKLRPVANCISNFESGGTGTEQGVLGRVDVVERRRTAKGQRLFAVTASGRHAANGRHLRSMGRRLRELLAKFLEVGQQIWRQRHWWVVCQLLFRLSVALAGVQ